jgi:hypothetical protein
MSRFLLRRKSRHLPPCLTFDVRQLKDSWTPANQSLILHQITKPVSNSVAIAHSMSRPSNGVTQVEDAAAFLRVGHYCLRGYVGWFHKRNEPNKALEPIPANVTGCACAPPAPLAFMAHL